MTARGLLARLATTVLLLLPGAHAASAQSFDLPGSPAEGARRFEVFQCSTCHGVGASRDSIGPNLGRVDLRMPFFDGAADLWNHLPGMDLQLAASRIVRPQLQGEDMLNLVAFFTTYQYYLTRVGRPGQEAVGEVLFRDKGCTSCHTATPGVPSKAPNLSRYGGGRSVLELAQAMWNHGPKMQAMLDVQVMPRPFFKEREMADVLAYLAVGGAPAGATTAYIEPGSPARGAKVFATRGCGNCHAIRGVGGLATPTSGETPPPDLGRSGSVLMKDYTDIAALMWNHAVVMWSRIEREGISLVPLGGSDLADLVSFLFFLNFLDEPGDETVGARLYERLGCVRCHGANGEGDGTDGGARLGTGAGPDAPWDVAAAMFRTAPKMEIAMVKRGLEWPQIGRGEYRDLIAFVTKLRKDLSSQATTPPGAGEPARKEGQPPQGDR